MSIKEEVVRLLKTEPQSEPTVARVLAKQGYDYFDLILNLIPEAFKELRAEKAIVASHNKTYFCGEGNGLGVEWFFKLAGDL